MKILVVGAGITGITIARVLADAGFKCEVAESRGKIGGNCSTHDDGGIEVHEYGPHIFHTSNRRVWEFINRFAEFNQFRLNVLTDVNGRKYHLPFGLDLVNSFFGTSLSPSDVEKFMSSKRVVFGRPPMNLEEQALSLVGREIYEAFIRGYTVKQWHADPASLPPEIIRRLPVRSTYDNSYYDDVWQGIPVDGYQKMLERMVSDDNIVVELNREVTAGDIAGYDVIFMTGQIDRFLRYSLGDLPWRSLRFEYETLGIQDYQGTAIVNYPSELVPYTRVHEYAHFHPERRAQRSNTVICREYPVDYARGVEAFYPMFGEKGEALCVKYTSLLEREYGNVIPCGRLAQFRYFDMDDAIANAMTVTDDFLRQIR